MNNFQGICKLNISIDDVNPKKCWRIIGEPTQKYLEDLHKEFGVKVSLFVPSNHHGDARISENKGWIQELKDLKFVELCAHGHFHNTTDTARWGECEFGELNSISELNSRIELMIREWETCNVRPRIWKSPGWLTSRPAVGELSGWFEQAVIHPQHNHNLSWRCKTITASDFFPPNSFPMMDCNMFILSHIYGKHDNTWNQTFFQHVSDTLNMLKHNVPVTHSFINEF